MLKSKQFYLLAYWSISADNLQHNFRCSIFYCIYSFRLKQSAKHAKVQTKLYPTPPTSNCLSTFLRPGVSRPSGATGADRCRKHATKWYHCMGTQSWQKVWLSAKIYIYIARFRKGSLELCLEDVRRWLRHLQNTLRDTAPKSISLKSKFHHSSSRTNYATFRHYQDVAYFL